MEKIKNIFPEKNGHHFVIFGDSCSGIPGLTHESNLSLINGVLQNLEEKPQFIIFTGDEITGLTNNEQDLRRQWDYWLNVEMKWVKQSKIPLYNSTGNHTTYNRMSERVFTEIFSNLPQNGPDEQKGLSYYITRNDLLLIFVNTMWSGIGGEGRIETQWLEDVLTKHSDYKFKIVIGHHPIFSANGFKGDFQREVESENGRCFWDILKKHNVFAYICSHILAFDVQLHEGVMQLLTAGAGTSHRMPEENEYLHLVQAAIDKSGICYQVIDQNGHRKEWLKWPVNLPPSKDWKNIIKNNDNLDLLNWGNSNYHCISVWNLSGQIYGDRYGYPQTLISGIDSIVDIPSIWIGLTGLEQKLTIYLSPEPRKSPHHWYGPEFCNNKSFNFQIMVHNGMRAGRLLFRYNDNDYWSSMKSASAWGAERLKWPKYWTFGKNHEGIEDKMDFKGKKLEIRWFSSEKSFQELFLKNSKQ